MTVDNEKKHRAKYKNSRIELKCATMTVEKESNICVMHKKSRMELRYLIFTVQILSNVWIEPQFAKIMVENAVKV